MSSEEGAGSSRGSWGTRGGRGWAGEGHQGLGYPGKCVSSSSSSPAGESLLGAGCAGAEGNVEGGPAGLRKAQGLLRDPGNLRAGRASGSKSLPSEKGAPPGGTEPECAGVLGAGTACQARGGGGWGQKMSQLPLGGLVGRRGPSSVVSSLRESALAQASALPTEKEKYTKEKASYR